MANGRAAAAVGVFALFAATVLSGQEIEFNRDIRPILSDQCFACHGPDAAKRKTKLRFDTESGARIELAKGRFAIVPGDPERSELVRRVTSSDTAVRMPPAYAGRAALRADEIERIRRWIAQGARWQPFWSFIPPQRPALPAVRDEKWVRNPIDRFILARLEREGLHPAPEADKAALLRRVSLDLTGLPPTPARGRCVSPGRFAGRLRARRWTACWLRRATANAWPSRWLDAARYADTNGYQTDGAADMWRWRDWVIDAFNRNLPFDQFTIEQLAGDLLPNATLDQKIATGLQPQSPHQRRGRHHSRGVSRGIRGGSRRDHVPPSGWG